jgi:glutathione synthase/RimK-type ligase-like ATP-grasp enzyme
MILILGAPDDLHAALIHTKIQQRGKQTAYFDTRQFPAQTRITFIPNDPEASYLQLGSEAEKIYFSDIHAVYWRTFLGTKTREFDEPYLKDIAVREIDSAIGSLVRGLDCLWVNSYTAIEQHRYKGYQLQLLHRAGLRVPETLITNNGDEVRRFYEHFQGNVIYKPVRGGAHTAQLTEADLTHERLRELSEAPVQFQEFIRGNDIRVYLVQDELFAAEILTNALDFRKDPNAKINPLTLPEAVAKYCFTVAKTFALVFTGIDIRRTAAEEYVFLEGNPSPMFIYFEKVTGYPISDRLVDLLLRGPL